MKTFEQMRNSPRVNFPEYIIVHHTGGTNANPLLDTSNQTFEIVQNYHISLGWENFGYNYFIDKKGKVTPGRPETYHGAHTTEQNMNKRSIGICLAGNFDATLPTKEQEESLKGLLSLLDGVYGIPHDKIVPHRHFAPKTCYGKKLPDDWARKLISTPTEKEKIKVEIKRLVDLL